MLIRLIMPFIPFIRCRWIGELKPRPPLTAESMFWMWFGFVLLSCSRKWGIVMWAKEFRCHFRSLPSRCVLTMSHLRFSAINTRMKMRKRRAQAPIAPTIRGKNDVCPLASPSTGFIFGWVVVGGVVGSKTRRLKFKYCHEHNKHMKLTHRSAHNNRAELRSR